MSADRFDELARTLAGETSRRAALKGLARWAVKGVTISLGLGAAATLGPTQVAEARKCSSTEHFCAIPGSRGGGSCCNKATQHCCHTSHGSAGCLPLGTPCPR